MNRKLEEIYNTIFEENPEIFAEGLKLAREIKGYTQKDIAEMAGLDSSTISRYENGERFPKKETFEKLINIL